LDSIHNYQHWTTADTHSSIADIPDSLSTATAGACRMRMCLLVAGTWALVAADTWALVVAGTVVVADSIHSCLCSVVDTRSSALPVVVDTAASVADRWSTVLEQ
jgi:hypothetical protein